MMTSILALLALSSYFLWRRKAHWGWAAVMAALLIGIVIFVRDVDFTSSLGVQL
jgi:drug/metabolite transporter (DMT)-like permease